MLKDYIKLGLGNITHRKLRSWLTMIGIFIGIMAVVALISLGQGLQTTIDREFEKVGGDRIMVLPGGGGFGMMSNPGMSNLIVAKLHESDLDVIRKVRGVDQAIGMITIQEKIEFKDKIKYTQVFATDTDIETLKFAKQFDYLIVDQGRYLREGDKYKAIVGVKTGEDLFDRDIDLGAKILVNDVEFVVVGINKRAGNPGHDTKVTIPLDTAREIFDKPDEFGMISVKAQKGYQPSDIAEDIKKKLRRHRKVKEGEEDFSVETAENVVAAFKNVLGIVSGVLVGIASISLVVGGVGIMTSMYTSVMERTRQIGIMKAIGARNKDIMMIFLVEAGMLGIVGGIVGVILGVGLSKGVELIAAYFDMEIFQAYLGLDLILGALSFSFIVGCLSGILPARKAAKMNPVEALRFR